MKAVVKGDGYKGHIQALSLLNTPLSQVIPVPLSLPTACNACDLTQIKQPEFKTKTSNNT